MGDGKKKQDVKVADATTVSTVVLWVDNSYSSLTFLHKRAQEVTSK